jgi:predicted  nucleic acid-binding Zn-ribbon protein
MHADLERVIALQRLDSAAHEARRRLAEEPERARELDARLEAVRQRIAAEKARLADNQTARRNFEKDAAVHQTRLSKFRDQLMAVKTNVEYQAMQKEIEFAQNEVKAIEERILEQMLAGDEITAAVKALEHELSAEQKAVDADRRALAAELAKSKADLERIDAERSELTRSIAPDVLHLFALVSERRHGVAVAEARDGICTICHVRLRPQVFNTIRRNAAIVQCDSCQRILYFVQPAVTADEAPRPAQPQ